MEANTYETQGIGWNDSAALDDCNGAGFDDASGGWHLDDTAALYAYGDDAGDLFGDIGDAVKKVTAPVVNVVKQVAPQALKDVANQAAHTVQDVAKKAADIGKGAVQFGVGLTKTAPFKLATQFASLATNPLHAAATLGSYIPGISQYAKEIDKYTDPGRWAAMIARQIPGVRNFASQLDSIGQTVDASSIINKTAQSIANGAPLTQALLDGAREGLAVAKKAASGMAAYPGFGTGVAAAIGAADSLINGAPLTDAVLAAAKNAIPGGPGVQAAFETGVRAADAAANGKSIEESVLQAARNNLPGGEAAKVAFDTAVALAHGKRIQDIVASEVADRILQQPELRALQPAELAKRLGVTPAAAQKAVGSLTAVARQVGAPNAGALPNGTVRLPALRSVSLPALRALGNTSLNHAVARFASRAAAPVQGPQKTGHHMRLHKTHLRQHPMFARLNAQQRALVIRDAAGYAHEAGSTAMDQVFALANTAGAPAASTPPSAAAAAEQQASYSGAAILKLGSKGADVVTWQHSLNALGYKGSNGQPLAEDGDFGANSVFATKAFQTDKGLTVDGQVGPASLSAMHVALSAAPVPVPLPASPTPPPAPAPTPAPPEPLRGVAPPGATIPVTPASLPAQPHIWTASEYAQAQTQLAEWVSRGMGANYGGSTVGSFTAANVNGNWDAASQKACGSFQAWSDDAQNTNLHPYDGSVAYGTLDEPTWAALASWTAANVTPAPTPAPVPVVPPSQVIITPGITVQPASVPTAPPPAEPIPNAPTPAPDPTPALPPGGSPMPALPTTPAVNTTPEPLPPPAPPKSSGGGSGGLIIAAVAVAALAMGGKK